MSELKEFHNENRNIEVRKLEMELRKTIEELQINNKDLKEQKERAEQSDKLKSIFLANMSHEIHTPMNSIIGFSSLLLSNGHNRSKTKEFLKIINKNGEGLLKLINDIIDFSKIEVGELKLDKIEFNMNELMNEIYNSFLINKNLINKNIKFNIDTKENNICHILSDKNRIRQILTNLISNAIKFTESGEIKFGCYFIEPNILKCYVKDTGPGISCDNQKEIFDRFVQINRKEHSKKEGTGLGLSISKGLIELLNGEMNVKSKIDKGTIFYFTIPVEKIKKIEKIKMTHNKKYNFNNVKISIAEDIEDNFDLLYEYLKDTNCDIFRAENGLECLKLFKKNKYDIILMDIRMPIMSGYDAIKEIREIDKTIPIIAQTAYGYTNDKERLLKLGCSDYLSKPMSQDNLLKTISKYI